MSDTNRSSIRSKIETPVESGDVNRAAAEFWRDTARTEEGQSATHKESARVDEAQADSEARKARVTQGV